MKAFSQGDLIKVSGFKNLFLIVSNNSFINSTGVFHVCPVTDSKEGVLHISVIGKKGNAGVVICEQIKLLDPAARSCMTIDRIGYSDIMNISDAIQGVFEYD